MEFNADDPIEGISIEFILVTLFHHFGWAELYSITELPCFKNNPNLKSCLNYIDRNPKAQLRLEELYITIIPPKKTKK